MVNSDSDKTLLLMQITVYGEYVLSNVFIINFIIKQTYAGCFIAFCTTFCYRKIALAKFIYSGLNQIKTNYLVDLGR